MNRLIIIYEYENIKIVNNKYYFHNETYDSYAYQNMNYLPGTRKLIRSMIVKEN